MATRVYFLNDHLYLRYGSGSGAAQPGFPQPVAGNWPGIMEAGGGYFENGFDTVVNWGNGKAYFFLEAKYLRYDIGANRADPGYPLPIAGNWPGLGEAGFGGRVDALINWGNGKAYVFSYDKYLRYDILADRTDPGYPLPIAGNWPGLAEAGFAPRIGAGLNWGNGKVYLFRYDKYVRYDMFTDRADLGYPRPIAGNWPGVHEAGFTSGYGIYAAVKWGQNREYLFQRNKYLPFDVGVDEVDDGYPLPIAGYWPGMAEAGFGANIDAAINWGNGKAYLFRGDKYVRYDIFADRVDSGYPLPIAGYWPGMAEAGFGANIGAAINWGNGKAYLFRGDKYVRYDIYTDRVDPGYPLPIAGYWPGMAEAGFGANIDAAINWGNGKAYLFRGDKYVRYDIFADRVDSGYPLPIAGYWPGMAEAGFGNRIQAAIEL